MARFGFGRTTDSGRSTESGFRMLTDVRGDSGGAGNQRRLVGVGGPDKNRGADENRGATDVFGVPMNSVEGDGGPGKNERKLEARRCDSVGVSDEPNRALLCTNNGRALLC